MAKQNVRVKIPRNPDDMLTLAAAVYGKHQKDGAASPLNALSDFNWTDNGGKVAEAKDLNDKAKQMEKDLEELYKRRDILTGPIDSTLKSSRDLLLSVYKTNYKKLGEWGYEVDDTPRAPKTKKGE